jgi:hypothetical protein
MRRWHAILPVAAALVAVVVACASAKPVAGRAAGSNSGQVSILQDDQQLIYSGPQRQTKTLRELKALGVNVVKVTMVWWLVGPDANGKQRPSNFDASDPAAYGPAAWTRYDTLVRTAQKLGLKVYFQFTPPDPVWARDRSLSGGQGDVHMRAPNALMFQQFVKAVGTRYSGTYGSPALPRVSWWGIWNEPNYPAWLNPQHRTSGGVHELLPPSLYRSLADAAWNGLSATGHGSDTIMIGETANRGIPTTIPFVEDLYCVDSHYRPLSGKAALKVACPKSGNRSKFKAANPGLFHIAGYAHHPYQFSGSPGKPDRTNPQWVTIHNLSWLEHVLKHVFASYGISRNGGVPLYLTEWGFITHPPHPPSGAVSISQASAWLNLGEYLSWRDPYVKALAQYLLRDAPNNGFATGLEFITGKPKADLHAFRLPIWLPDARHGHHVTVWGQLRPAFYTGSLTGTLQFRGHGSSGWKTLTTVHSPTREGFFLVHVSIPAAGEVRLKWGTSHSRDVSVS